jgi:hypothetical protein
MYQKIVSSLFLIDIEIRREIRIGHLKFNDHTKTKTDGCGHRIVWIYWLKDEKETQQHDFEIKTKKTT